MFRTVTFAPMTAAPEGSEMWPRMVPREFCALKLLQSVSAKKMKAAQQTE
jgi:hypothetical protein